MDCIVRFDALEWQQICRGMRVKIYANGDKIIRMIELSEGFADDEWCTNSHTNYIVEGAYTAEFSDETVQFREGDILYIPSGRAHRAILRNGERVVMLDF